MNFNVTYDSTITSQSQAFQSMFQTAVNAVIEYFEHAFTNNVTVDITFGWSNLGGGAAAQNSFFYNTYTYSQIETALINSQTSLDDITAYTTLPVNDPTGSGHLYALTTGEARALGLAANPPSGQPDDYVILNSALAWTFDPNHRAVAGAYDALGAMAHEITEGVFGRFASLGQSAAIGPGIYSPLDLFRYSSPGVRDFDPNHVDFFSIDGTHLLTQFNNWASGNPQPADLGDWFPTVQGDAFGDAFANTVGLVTPTDLRELDVLGWNRAPGTSHDFNGDGTSDILWRNSDTGLVVEWSMNGRNVTSSSALGGDANWSVIDTGDFNGDGRADLLWRNNTTGVVVEWEMNGLTVTSSGVIGGDNNWSVIDSGDFNGDGKSDLLWRNNTTGMVVEWEMNGRTVTSSGVVGGDVNWSVIGTGDFNGDGKSDLLWRNNTTGMVVEWEMNGRTVTSSGVVGGDVNWSVIGTGDFNGDGKADLLWRNNATGVVFEWEMNGRNVTSSGVIGGDLNWKVIDTGDYNGDGRSDILWQNGPTGGVIEWEMNGRTVTSSGVIAGDPHWLLVT